MARIADLGSEGVSKIVESIREQVNILYSSSVDGSLRDILGLTHYSYRFSEMKFVEMFRRAGLNPVKLEMPEYYATNESLKSRVTDPYKCNVHLIFRSTEDIRLLKPAYNVCCFAWEFDVLRDFTLYDEHPFKNQKRMLKLLSEIWVPSNYTRDVLDQHNVENAVVLPAPVEPPARGRLGRNEALGLIGRVPITPLCINAVTPRKTRARTADSRSRPLIDWLLPILTKQGSSEVFLTIVNPQDHRKNVDAFLRAFDYFSRDNPRAMLIVKLVTSNSRYSLGEASTNLIFEELQGGTYLSNGQIVFLNSFLTDKQMLALYSLTDFYLSSTIAEGQNLPLLEAMSVGCVAVTTRHTAMLDYVTARNAILIDSRSIPATDPQMAGHIAARPYHIQDSRVSAILQGLRSAVGLSDQQRRARADAAFQTIQRNFAEEVVLPSALKRLRYLMSEQAAQRAG